MGCNIDFPNGRADSCNGNYPKALRGMLVTKSDFSATRVQLVTKSFLQGLVNNPDGPDAWYGVINTHDDTSPGPTEYSTPTGSGITKQMPRQFTAYFKSNLSDYQDIYKRFQNFFGRIYLVFDGKTLEGTEPELDVVKGYQCEINAIKKMPTQDDNQQWYEARVYLQDVEEELDSFYASPDFSLNGAIKDAMPVGLDLRIVSNASGSTVVKVFKRGAVDGTTPAPYTGLDETSIQFNGNDATTVVEGSPGEYTVTYTSGIGAIQVLVVDTVLTHVSNKVNVVQ